MLTPGPTPKIWTKRSKFQVLFSKNVSLQNHRIHNQNIYNYACADVSGKEDVHCIFACPPPPHPLEADWRMHEGWGRTGRETYMDVFIHDVNSLNHKVYI